MSLSKFENGVLLLPIGTVVKHYKYSSTKNKKKKNNDKNNRYLYKIIAYATDQDDNFVVVYQALYRIDNDFKVFTRKVDDFYSDVMVKDVGLVTKFTKFDPEVD